MKKAILQISIFLISFGAFATNVKGIIKNSRGEALPFASIIVKGTTNGTMANANAEYLIPLQSGTYELVFQFLGYKSSTKSVVIGKDEITLNVILEEQIINLEEFRVGAGEEDPAYTIMRRAIAKSKIHDLQVNSYEVNAYIKNNFLLKSIPFFLKSELAKDNIKVGIPMVSEAVIEFKFSQPNNRFTRVIARKTNGFEKNVRISDDFYLMNFYKQGGRTPIISPLSPNAFSHYKFEYLGYFVDRGLTINKIRVIPRNYGSNEWRGEIYIIENYWNIHSLDLETVYQGVNYRIKQIYAPTQKIWMPVNQNVEVFGSMLGFEFDIKSHLNPTYKALTTNPAFIEEIKVIDEKKDGLKQNSLSKAAIKEKSFAEILSKQKEFSLKELSRLQVEFEKDQKRLRKEQKGDVVAIRNDSVVVDSMVLKRDTSFWQSVRTIPLTEEEAKGYKFADSIKVAKIEKKDSLVADSLKKRWKRFVYAYNFKLNDNGLKLKFEPPYTPLVGLNYNIVEGITTNLGLNFHRNYDENKPSQAIYNIDTDWRYGFENKRFTGKIESSYQKGVNQYWFGIGSYKTQFDSKSGIADYVNTITTLLGYNITKIYQKDYFHFGYAYQEDKRFKVSTDLEVANRSQMDNLPNNQLLFVNDKLPFTSNSPQNIELGKTDFATHEVLVWNVELTWQPALRYRIYNGKRIYLDGNLPKFSLNYRKGMQDVDYDFLSLKVMQKFSTGWAGKMNYLIEVGDFLNANKLYLMDMKNINSMNLTNIGEMPENLFAHYRLLESTSPIQISAGNYYTYSTKGQYIKAHAINEFNSLFLTQIPALRLLGIKEDLFINYLKTPTLNNYTEFGYGIDGIFRVLRLEAITSFRDGKYTRWGWQIGVTF